MTNILLLSLLFSFGPLGGAPADRCAELGDDGYPIDCQPIGWRVAPVWNDVICCDEASCAPSGPLGCTATASPYFCKHGELDALDKVSCMFPVAHFCDEQDCPPAMGDYMPHPEAQVICCYEEGCYAPDGDICGGILYWCDHGSSNADGTVSCDDEDVPN